MLSKVRVVAPGNKQSSQIQSYTLSLSDLPTITSAPLLTSTFQAHSLQHQLINGASWSTQHDNQSSLDSLRRSYHWVRQLRGSYTAVSIAQFKLRLACPLLLNPQLTYITSPTLLTQLLLSPTTVICFSSRHLARFVCLLASATTSLLPNSQVPQQLHVAVRPQPNTAPHMSS